MLAKNDIKWLATAYRFLKSSDSGKQVEGPVQFTGAYDKAQNKFTLVGSGDTTTTDGIILSGEYRITIRENNNPERLPKLFVHDDELPHEANRHFYPKDESACVCGVIEEARFLKRGFDFQKYLEEMVIPFLYGQKYYDEHGKWPWRDYAHGTAGVLESYFFDSTEEFIYVALKRLRLLSDWEHIKTVLKNKNQPKGHMPCFCQSYDHIRRCHPIAWEGIKKLYLDVKLGNLKID